MTLLDLSPSPVGESAIRDSDLKERLAAAPRNTFYAVVLRDLVKQQQRRDAESARKAGLTILERRRESLRDRLQSQPLSDSDRHYIHSVLALCALPYRRPTAPATSSANTAKARLSSNPIISKTPSREKWLPRGCHTVPKRGS